MNSVKLGYVVRYPNPPGCKSMDKFLRLDTTGPRMVVDTDCVSLELATVFENEETAKAFAASAGVLAMRSVEINEVQQVTHRKLISPSVDGLLTELLKARPSFNPYDVKIGLVEDKPTEAVR